MTDADNWTDAETGTETYTRLLTSASLGYVIAIATLPILLLLLLLLLLQLMHTCLSLPLHLLTSVLLFIDTNWRFSVGAVNAKLFAVELHWVLAGCLFRSMFPAATG